MEYGSDIVVGIGGKEGNEYANHKHVGHGPFADHLHEPVQGRPFAHPGHQQRCQQGQCLDNGHYNTEQQNQEGNHGITIFHQPLDGREDTPRFIVDILFPHKGHAEGNIEGHQVQVESRHQKPQGNHQEEQANFISGGVHSKYFRGANFVDFLKAGKECVKFMQGRGIVEIPGKKNRDGPKVVRRPVLVLKSFCSSTVDFPQGFLPCSGY
jgi:hypothetical protein